MENRIKKLSFWGNIFELVWIVLAISLFLYLYTVLDVDKIDEVYDTLRYYDFLGFKQVPETTINLIMGLCVFVLMVNVPLFVINYKNYRINFKEEIEYDREMGIYQVIAAGLQLITTNIPSAVCYGLSGRQIIKEKPKTKVKFVNPDYGKDVDVFKELILKILLFGFLITLALIIIIPFYWMILTSLMSRARFDDFTRVDLFLALREMNWINFKEALDKANFALYIRNTLIVSFWSTIGTVLTTILAAFAFARLEFKGRDLLFSVFLMTMMVPGELYVITNYVTVVNFNWINTFYALIIPFTASVFFIFFLRQTFKQVPDSLYRAAKVDGCSDFKFLTRIMVPIAIPTLITITILSALGAWNAFVWPSLVAEEELYLVSIALRRTFTHTDSGIPDFRLQMAAATIVTVPILIVFLFARKYIMRGVGRSGTKG